VKKLLYLGILFFPTFVFSQTYQRASATDENVKNKKFPKTGNFDASVPAFGLLLGQSYIDAYIAHGAFSYFFNESWGLSLEGAWIFNSDRPERYCLEHFYNDPLNQVPIACPQPGDGNAPLQNPDGTAVKGANVGPAYVPIRELNTLVFLSMIWNPVYGKQLAFLSKTSYFDIFTTIGLGAALSTFYPESLNLKNGKLSRGLLPDGFKGTCPSTFGVCPDDPNYNELVGASGRPSSESQTNAMITLGIGQKFHFANRFHIKAEVRNFTLFGGPLGYEAYYALWLGAGLRF
jgi:outer membrane beta-barrel protein